MYRDMKNGRTRVITVVRKATGDLQVGTNHSGNVFPVWRNYSSCTDSRHHLEQRVPGVKIDTTPSSH